MTRIIATALFAFASTGPSLADQTRDQSGNLAPGGGSREQSRARQGMPAGATVETGPKSVPEFNPAFPGQTRAPAVITRTPLQVTEIASGFDRPWAIAFLPDGRMLVTEKPGRLRIVTAGG
jgi:glucose/arabinose dehydrogenase